MCIPCMPVYNDTYILKQLNNIEFNNTQGKSQCAVSILFNNEHCSEIDKEQVNVLCQTCLTVNIAY